MSCDVTIMGNLTRDPELKYTNDGRPALNLAIAVTRKHEGTSYTSFYECVAWGELGENMADSLKKGDRVIANGRIEQQAYKDRDGEDQRRWKVTLWDVGPSLRWATVQGLTRNNETADRGAGVTRASTPERDDPAPAPASATRTAHHGDVDEEPF